MRRAASAAAPRAERERRRLLEPDRELSRAQRDSVDFLANVSHDLRSPLANLREFVSIVEDGLAGPLTAQQHDYLGIALRNADLLVEMIEHLLVLAQIQQGNFRVARRRVRLAEILNDESILKGSWPKDKEVRLRVAVAPDLPDVFADPDRLLEAIRNLVDNAVRYSGDRVTIDVEAAEGADAMVDIRVRDNGVGMDPATLRHLFKRFYRGKAADRMGPGGLGLGLSIVKEIVELHGGQVAVDSAPARGTQFVISLPRYDPRGILVASIRGAWRRSAEQDGGFGFVRATVGRSSGALGLSREETLRLIRETMRRVLHPDDEFMFECGTAMSLCFLLAAERDAIQEAASHALRSVADRLSFQSATYVTWDSEPTWLHSDDFSSPEEMAAAVYHRVCSRKGRTDA